VCDYEPKNAGGVVAAFAALPVALAASVVGQVADGKGEEYVDTVMRTSMKIGDEIGPPMAKAAAGAALFAGAVALVNLFRKK
jgi:hypothetical protein